MKIPAREVAEHVHNRVGRMRALYPHIFISQSDWDDIAQDITIHVAAKWRKHQRGPTWRRWVNTITRNQVVNKIRDRIRTYRRMPMVSMSSRIEQDDYTGVEEIIYEPDMAVSEDGVLKTRAALAELTDPHKRLVAEFMEAGTWDKARKTMGLTVYTLPRMRAEMAAQVKAMI